MKYYIMNYPGCARRSAYAKPGASGEGRTLTLKREIDFESIASASSATEAYLLENRFYSPKAIELKSQII